MRGFRDQHTQGEGGKKEHTKEMGVRPAAVSNVSLSFFSSKPNGIGHKREQALIGENFADLSKEETKRKEEPFPLAVERELEISPRLKLETLTPALCRSL